MMFSRFGYSVSNHGSVEMLDERLEIIIDAGYTHAELVPESWDVWLGGHINSQQLNRYMAVVEKYRRKLEYTMHLPVYANLFDLADQDTHQRLLKSGIKVGEEIGAQVMVYHPGWRPRRPKGTSIAMFELMARERDILIDLADQVSSWNSHIAIETWINTGGTGYSYAIWPELLAKQVKAINHPAIGLCLDFGHVYLASRWYGFDFIDGVAQLAPLATHFHVADNLGVMDFEDRKDFPLGRGDLHLPPSWGDIPYNKVFSQLDFPHFPVFTLEVNDKFFPHASSMLAESIRLTSLKNTETGVPDKSK